MPGTRFSVTIALGLVPAVVCAQEPDFSTPEATVNTFLQAIASTDIDLLSECFSVNAEEEFTPIREKKVSESDWTELQELFDGAEITDTAIAEDDESATVHLKGVKRRAEALYLVREGDGWKIRGF